MPETGGSAADLIMNYIRSLKARDADPSFRAWIDESAEAVLTVEFEGDAPDSVAARLAQVRTAACSWRSRVTPVAPALRVGPAARPDAEAGLTQGSVLLPRNAANRG